MLALYGIRQYWDGKRVGTKTNRHDVYAQPADLPWEYLGTPQDQGWRELLIDSRRSPVPDQAAFRIDFPRWLHTLPQRDRDIVLRLCQGERPVEVARQHRITRVRVSQFRKKLYDGWLRSIEATWRRSKTSPFTTEWFSTLMVVRILLMKSQLLAKELG